MRKADSRKKILSGVCKGLDFNSLMIGLLYLSVDLIYSVAFLSTKEEIGKYTLQNENRQLLEKCARSNFSDVYSNKEY